MVSSNSDSWFKRAVTRQFLLAVWACLFGSIVQVQAAWAQAERVVIELPIYGQLIYGELTTQAESMVQSSIDQHFAQSGSQSEIEVVVVGSRHGEIVPISTTAVSRSQWQATPQVSAWTRYYSASQALLQRHQEPARTVANASNQTTGSSWAYAAAEIDAALDSGRLTGAAAQSVLSSID